MKGILLKFHFLFFLLFLLTFGIKAQELRFVYIQTENLKPFYIKLDGKILSSSAAGYLIIPRLTQDFIKLRIGFPQSRLEEFMVTLNLNGTNAGFLLKKEIDQNWGMANLRTMEPLTIEKPQQAIQAEEYVITKDEFAIILSEVVNDSSIRKIKLLKSATIALVKSDEKKSVNPVVEIKSDSLIQISSNAKADKSGIIKLLQDSTAEGIQITYIDTLNAAADTINVFIPVKKTDMIIINEAQKKLISSDVKKEEEAGIDSKFINMELQNPNTRSDSGALKKEDLVITKTKKDLAEISNARQYDSTTVSKKDTALINLTCREIATQTDFLELRKKMAAEKTETGMSMVAIQQFANTCFTTEQIKNLGVLYIEEAERYIFYLAAFPCVSDSANFKTLESQFADAIYITRFKELFNH